MSTMSDKQAARAQVLTARRSTAADDRRTADQRLASRTSDLVSGHSVVAAYAPVPGEPGGDYLLDALLGSGPAILLPVLRPDLDLTWAWFTGDLGAPGPGGVRAPTGPPLDPLAIARASVVLVPALAVDRRGVRLGRGGGSYDRALARVEPGTLVAALVYESELVSALPADAHDVRVTHALTPSGLVACEG